MFRVVLEINKPWYFVSQCSGASLRRRIRVPAVTPSSEKAGALSNTHLPLQPKPRTEVPRAQQEQRLSHPKGYKCLQWEHQQNMQRLEPWKQKRKNIITTGRCWSTRKLQLSNGKLLGKEVGNEQLLLQVCGSQSCAAQGRQAGRLSWDNHLLLQGALQRCQSSFKQAVSRWHTH